MSNLNKKCGIYKITSPTGRYYIGQSADIIKRWKQYKNLNCKKQIKLHNSFKKYGVKEHQFDIIEYCEVEQLNCSERFWQDIFDVLGKLGLNCVLQECGEKRKIYTEELKKKISESNKGLQNITGKNNPMWGKKHSEETLLKMSEIKKGKYVGENNPMYGKEGGMKGKTHTQEAKDKISKIHMGNEYSKGEKNFMFGKKHSEETKEKMRKKHPSIKGVNNPNSKLLIDTQTGIFYDCIADAAKAYEIKYYTLSEMLNPNKRSKNKTNLIYCQDE